MALHARVPSAPAADKCRAPRRFPRSGRPLTCRKRCAAAVFLQFERLEPRTVLSGTTFAQGQILIQPEVVQPLISAADLDGDGDLDILLGTQPIGSVYWYENTDGAGTFGPLRAIGQVFQGTELSPTLWSVVPVDFDRDGDQDVVWESTWYTSLTGDTGVGFRRIAWFENLDRAGDFGPAHVLKDLPGQQNGSSDSDLSGTQTSLADLDSDGDLDLLRPSPRDGHIYWYENTDGAGNFGSEKPLAAGLTEIATAMAVDLDGDKDLDLLARHYYGVVWFRNEDGRGTFGDEQVVTLDTQLETIATGDLDGDGDQDVVASANPSIANAVGWYENTDGLGTFGTKRAILSSGSFVGSPLPVDLDGDGDLDVVGARDSAIVWHENLDGSGNFGSQRTIAEVDISDEASVIVADLDSDQDADCLLAVGDSLTWYENSDGDGRFDTRHVLVLDGGAPIVTASADLDGDGDEDLLAGFWWWTNYRVAWYENIDGLGTLGPQQSIGDLAGEEIGRVDKAGNRIYTADLDGDGDQDVLSESSWFIKTTPSRIFTGKLSWYENTDGAGHFGPERLIARVSPFSGATVTACRTSPGDLDGDGDLDIVFLREGALAWLENLDGTGTFGPEQMIYPLSFSSTRLLTSVFTADIDGDNDLDVVSGTTDIVWYENTDGAGNFGPGRRIGLSKNRKFFGADLDGDGDTDVVDFYGPIDWYENTDGHGSFGPARRVVVGASYDSVVAGDLDGDGDLDLVHHADYSSLGTWFSWSENIDGAGDFAPPQVMAVLEPIPRTSMLGVELNLGDLDRDGDQDIVLANPTLHALVWHENLLPHPGDANRDGRFDSADFLQVFQTGEYEDDIAGNSTWEEGDWNGDGDFDSADFVAAFQTGLYEVKSQAAGSPLAAAVDWLFSQDQRPARRRAYVT